MEKRSRERGAGAGGQITENVFSSAAVYFTLCSPEKDPRGQKEL